VVSALTGGFTLPAKHPNLHPRQGSGFGPTRAPSLHDISRVELGDEGNNQSALAVTLRASVPGASASEAKRLLHDAHESCPYSRAVRGNVSVNLELD